jgi:MSHA biogenesis protein MshN
MSLINKMLQDLDARGTPAAESFPSQIRPVAQERRGLAARFSPKAVAAIVIATLAALALGWFVRAQFQHAQHAQHRQVRTADQPVAAAAGPVKPAPAAVKPAQGMSSTITTGPANALAPAPAAPVAAAAQQEAQRGTKHEALHKTKDEALHKTKDEAQHKTKREAKREAKLEAKHKTKHETKREAKHTTKHAADKEERRARKAAAPAAASASASAARSKAADTDAPAARARRGVQGRQESVSQRAEGEYRRALASLQDGRMTETVAALEQALKLDPGHDAARQTLVGLLIEAKRTDEAMRHLQAGLALDARQPALAMLLARLQIERGGSGIETLTRTLPYARNDAGYHAFLAGALARAQRHREAAEQYQAALRAAPGNGVWWMGLGMSLQADQRNAEALEAFQRARASGTLSAELQTFVERRLQQLGR